jgi:DinB family protein
MSISLLSEITKTNADLFVLIDSFDENELNQVPFENSWTAGQVANHLKKSDSFIHYLLTAPTRETQRPADQNVGQLRDVFLNFDKKLDAPDMIAPDTRNFTREEALGSLKDIRSKILEDAANTDLTLTTTVKSPLGAATLLEMLHFHLFHTQRHIHQLEKIRAVTASRV